MSKSISEILQQTRVESGLNWGEYDATHLSQNCNFSDKKTLVKVSELFLLE